MKKLLNPQWIFFITALPIILLFVLGRGELAIIESLLDSEGLYLWSTFATVLFILVVGSTGYAIVRMIQKKQIDFAYSIFSFIFYTLFVYMYYIFSDQLIPDSIPRWMTSGNAYMYVGTFIMPTLLHSLFSIVIRLTPNEKDALAWPNFFMAMFTPLLFYIFAIFISTIWNGIAKQAGDDFVIAVITTGVVFFMFFFLRFIYILVSRRKVNNGLHTAISILFTLVFPMIGLLLNVAMGGLFGDFSNIWFFILALINGVLVCLPKTNNKYYRLALFFGRSVTFVYTFYFFLVFLPLLPLSVFAIIIVGLGFVMLAPIVLFIVHINEMIKDFEYLKYKFNVAVPIAICLIALPIIPAAVTFSYKQDRVELNEMLNYLYSPNYSEEYKPNADKILKNIKILNDRGVSDRVFGSTPYLTGYFKWIAFDNLNISNEKKNLISDLLEGTNFRRVSSAPQAWETRNSGFRETPIEVIDLKHNSRYDADQQAWVSWVDLSLKNHDQSPSNSEYKTTIDLPAGCWISDYYLYVGERKEMGILAEKKAATWIFNQIRNVNQDPGLLRYIGGNKVEFKVFPFLQGETRYTGIEFVHREAVNINIDGNIVTLGDSLTTTSAKVTADNGKAIYLSSHDKQVLKTVERKPYYHFIIDTSTEKTYESYYYENNNKPRTKEDRVRAYTSEITELLNKKLIDNRDAKISYVNTSVRTVDMKTGWQEELTQESFEGGFFLDRAVKQILFDSYTNPKDTYPIIVVLSSKLSRAILYHDFADMQFAYPEGDEFYLLEEYKIKAYNLFSDKLEIKQDSIVDSFSTSKVRVYPSSGELIAYLPDNNNPEVILNTKAKSVNIPLGKINEKSWKVGLQMQGEWMNQSLHPETADEGWLPLIQYSFKSRIMTPFTSYIVVENDAQKAMLKKKQEDTLNGDRKLDLDDDTTRMSEPNMYVILALLFVIYLANRWRKSRLKA